ncbi:MAG: sugar nucleotide-binding protein, partial [Oscillospiraceae bacterium]|nr:sugar nucleotide-binding protein [Oscillospiraceae bacterium]
MGSNLAGQYGFDGLFHSKNIADAFGSRPDICFYAGVPAQKFLANRDPEQDKRVIQNAMENIRRIDPARLILISTIDVFAEPAGADETTAVTTEGLHPYGLHRYMLEEWVREHCEDAFIIRLPALFGANLKKNFLYDLIHLIPAMLPAEKFESLRRQDRFLGRYYQLGDNGMYGCKPLSDGRRNMLRDFFDHADFNAVYFTDSRAVFPFYNLRYLRQHIDAALADGLRLLHCAVEP